VARNFFTIENAGVEDGCGGEIGEAFWQISLFNIALNA
jgi:hypothetical protein